MRFIKKIIQKTKNSSTDNPDSDDEPPSRPKKPFLKQNPFIPENLEAMIDFLKQTNQTQVLLSKIQREEESQISYRAIFRANGMKYLNHTESFPIPEGTSDLLKQQQAHEKFETESKLAKEYLRLNNIQTKESPLIIKSKILIPNSPVGMAVTRPMQQRVESIYDNAGIMHENYEF